MFWLCHICSSLAHTSYVTYIFCVHLSTWSSVFLSVSSLITVCLTSFSVCVLLTPRFQTPSVFSPWPSFPMMPCLLFLSRNHSGSYRSWLLYTSTTSSPQSKNSMLELRFTSIQISETTWLISKMCITIWRFRRKFELSRDKFELSRISGHFVPLFSFADVDTYDGLTDWQTN